MTKGQEMLELHKAGLEQLLAALHAGDPNRELYVRVGDLMRETDALLRLAAQAEAPGGQPQSPLWCCHVRGPDDVYAAPDYATALVWADVLNELNWNSRDPRYPKPISFKNPEKYEDCLIKAVPAIWPHSPESHAEDLPKSLAGFADPAVSDTRPLREGK